MTAYEIVQILKQYHITYTIEENLIPNQVAPIRITIENYIDYNDLIEILTKLGNFKGLTIGINCNVII